MLMADMQPGDIARITRCVYPNMENAYNGVLVMRCASIWACLDGKNDKGRHMRGDLFAHNAGELYEVKLVSVDINVYRLPSAPKEPGP